MHLAPPALAESWDNVGLLIGDGAQPVTTTLVALDASAAVLDQAADQQAELLVVHHPLIFSGQKRLVEDDGTATLIRRLIRENRSLIAMHTNLDAAPEGLNTYVARLLDLQDITPLVPSTASPLLKLVIYIPTTHVEAVRAAICAAGAGFIGRYTDCTFGTEGMGTFRPLPGTHPYLGTIDQLEHVPEVRLETVVPKSRLDAVLNAVFAHHPYEEVAYDLFPLENAWPNAGLGRVGRLATPVSAETFLARVSQQLQTDRLLLIGDRQRPVQTVALCTGAGGDFLLDAQRAHADLYLTGELKHHQALLAQQYGITVIDAGHFPTERPAAALLAEYLAAQCPDLRTVRAVEHDPFLRVGLLP